MPLSAGVAAKNCLNAASPPADAPMPTIGKSVRPTSASDGAVTSRSDGAVGGSEVFLSRCLRGTDLSRAAA